MPAAGLSHSLSSTKNGCKPSRDDPRRPQIHHPGLGFPSGCVSCLAGIQRRVVLEVGNPILIWKVQDRSDPFAQRETKPEPLR